MGCIKSQSIKTRLRAAFLIVFAIFVGVGLVVDQRMRVINDQSTEIAANWMPSIVAINAINTATSDYRTAEGQHILSTAETEMAAYEKEMDRLSKEIAEWRKQYKALIASEEELALYQSFTRKYDDYLKSSALTVALSRQNKNVEAAAQLKTSREVFDDMSGELVKLVKLNTQGGEQASAKGDVIYDDSRHLLLAVGIAVFALIVLIAWALERKIAPPKAPPAESLPAPPNQKLTGREAVSGQARGAPARSSGATKFRYSAPTLLIVAVAVMVISVSVISNKIFSGMTASMENEQFSLIRSIIESNLKNAETRALARAEMIADLPKAKALLAAQDRAGLLAEYHEMYETQHEKHGVDQAQFHTLPAVSFLRLHSPDKFGDDLSESRPLVVAANRDQVSQAGFAIARSGPAIFGVVPMFSSQNQPIGSFEMGIAFEGICDGIKAVYGVEMAIFVQEDTLWEVGKGVNKAIFSAQNRVGQFIRYYSTNSALMQQLIASSDFSAPEGQYTRDALGVPYGVSLVPLRNGAGEILGTLVAAKDFSALRSAGNRSLVWQTLMAFVSIIILAGFILIVIRGVLLRPLEMLTGNFGSLASGDTGVEATDTEMLCDELQVLAQQYERLRSAKAEESQ